jgi:SET domain-containing protein
MIVEIDEAIAIDCVRNGSPFRYVNHSCDPNLTIRVGDRWVRFYARRRIDPGEELTCDYGDSYHEGSLACACGSPKCRGFL